MPASPPSFARHLLLSQQKKSEFTTTKKKDSEKEKESQILPLGFHLGFTASGSAWFSSVPNLFTCKPLGFHLGFTASGSAWFSSVPNLFTCKRPTRNQLITELKEMRERLSEN